MQGHTNYIQTLVVTSDNKYIISGSYDRTIRTWNLLEKRQKTVFKGHSSNIMSVAVTKDNKYIISVSYDKTIRIWNFLKKNRSFQI